MLKIMALALALLGIISSPVFALRINDDAPLFSLRDRDGAFFHLSRFVGSKKQEPVKGIVVNFFSSSCNPCRQELSLLDALVHKFEAKGIKVVIIGYKEDFDKINEMLSSIKVNKPIVLSDPYGKTGEKYGVYGLPLTIIINADGKVKDIIRGAVPNIGQLVEDKAKRLLK